MSINAQQQIKCPKCGQLHEINVWHSITTALGTIAPDGRELGFSAGANVVMPNLSPISVRADYTLYDNKICLGDEAAEGLQSLRQRIEAAGLEMDLSRGDCVGFEK